MISMNEQYTYRGDPMTVVSITRPGEYPVIVYNTLTGEVWFFKADGSENGDEVKLLKVTPYSEYSIDEPVMVRDFYQNTWVRAYFAGIEDGKPLTWYAGATSWTTTNLRTLVRNQCRRPTAEELAT